MANKRAEIEAMEVDTEQKEQLIAQIKTKVSVTYLITIVLRLLMAWRGLTLKC